jgi:hypothetical protein
MALQDLYPAGRAPVVEGPSAPAAAGGCSLADASRRDASPRGVVPLLLMGASIVVTRRRR